jgi:hypothetical protein
LKGSLNSTTFFSCHFDGGRAESIGQRRTDSLLRQGIDERERESGGREGRKEVAKARTKKGVEGFGSVGARGWL